MEANSLEEVDDPESSDAGGRSKRSSRRADCACWREFLNRRIDNDDGDVIVGPNFGVFFSIERGRDCGVEFGVPAKSNSSSIFLLRLLFVFKPVNNSLNPGEHVANSFSLFAS